MSIDTQNSWYMRKSLSDCPNLFSKKETNNYQAHFYDCKCGIMKVVLSSNIEIPIYQCEACDNIHFVDASKAKKGYFILQQNENLPLHYECKKVYDGYIINAFLNIPYDADFMREQLLYKKEFIASLLVSSLEEKYFFNLPVEHFKEKDVLQRKIHKFIIEDTNDKLVYYKDFLKKQELIYPFHFHPNLRDSEFYLWNKIELRALINPKNPIGVVEMLHYLLNNRKERSLKRVLFKKYTHQLRLSPTLNSFNPLAAFVISRCFDDPNIASKLLAEDLAILSFEYDTEGREWPYFGKFASSIFIYFQIWFIKFLKIHYRENQLAKMFLEQDSVWHLWSDTLSLIAGNKRIIKRNFEKVKLTLENIHDEIVRCTNAQENEELIKLQFSYEENFEKACITMDNIEFRLPFTGKELGTWAQDMHNCISGYGLAIKNRYTTIYGAFRDDKMLYTIEASASEINEMSGKYNSEISTSDTNIINQWWKKYLYQTY